MLRNGPHPHHPPPVGQLGSLLQITLSNTSQKETLSLLHFPALVLVDE